MTIDIVKENDEADARLPISFKDTVLPLDYQMRLMALTIAQRHVGDTVVHEGSLYQQLKMDNKLGGPVTVDHVIRAALVFERYLWGEWSKGIAENAINATMTDAADVIEKEFEERARAAEKDINEPPIRPHGGSGAE